MNEDFEEGLTEAAAKLRKTNAGGAAFLLRARDEIKRLTDKTNSMARLMVECRDALPAISMTSAKLRGVSLSLADRLEAELEPWEVK